MDLFDYLRGAKLNNFEELISVDPTTGPSPFKGMLGMRKKLDNVTAAKFSDTNVGLCKNGIYQLWRSDPAIADVSKWVTGRPLFAKTGSGGDFIATTIAATTSHFIGVAIDTLEEAGNAKIIQVYGDALGLWAAASAKVVPALNDPMVLKIAANLADLQTLLDASAWTNVEQKLYAGRVLEVPANPAASGVKRFFLDGAKQIYNRGVM